MKKTMSYAWLALLVGTLFLPIGQANAGFFEDDEARRHILDVRSKLNDKADVTALVAVSGQIDSLRDELAALRNQVEELNNQLMQLKTQQKDFYLDIDERLKKLEPQQSDQTEQKSAQQSDQEQKDYVQAQDRFQAADYKNSIKLYGEFIRNYPQSHLLADAQYHLANSYYLQGNYREALKQQQVVIKRFPKNAVAPDAMYNMAVCEIALKNLANGKKTLAELIKKYPNSEAAIRAKKMLAQLG